MTRSYVENRAEGSALRRIELEYENRLCRAFSMGFSLVEIGKRIGCVSVIPIYRVLQRKGLISRAVKRRRQRAPERMERSLRRVRLSFIQWCNSWSFDPATAEEELATPDAPSPHGVREAALRDFPDLFERQEGSMDLEEWEREISSSTIGHSYRVDWDEKIEKFIGSIIGVESLTIIDRHPSRVMIELVRVTWLLRAIDLLRDMEEG